MKKKQKKLLNIVLVVIALLLGVYIFTARPTAEDISMMEYSTNDGASFYTEKLFIKNVYENEGFRLSGEIELPDPCYKLSNEVLIAESFPEQVIVNLTTSRDDTPCASVITSESFEIQYKADQKSTLKILLNGKEVDVVEDYTN